MRRSKRQRVYDHLEAVDQLLDFGAMERMDTKDLQQLGAWLEELGAQIELEEKRRAEKVEDD